MSATTTANNSNFTQISNLMPNDLIQFPLNDSNDDQQFFDQFSRLRTSALQQQQIISNLASSVNNSSNIQRTSSLNQQQQQK